MHPENSLLLNKSQTVSSSDSILEQMAKHLEDNLLLNNINTVSSSDTIAEQIGKQPDCDVMLNKRPNSGLSHNTPEFRVNNIEVDTVDIEKETKPEVGRKSSIEASLPQPLFVECKSAKIEHIFYPLEADIKVDIDLLDSETITENEALGDTRLEAEIKVDLDLLDSSAIMKNEALGDTSQSTLQNGLPMSDGKGVDSVYPPEYNDDFNKFCLKSTHSVHGSLNSDTESADSDVQSSDFTSDFSSDVFFSSSVSERLGESNECWMVSDNKFFPSQSKGSENWRPTGELQARILKIPFVTLHRLPQMRLEQFQSKGNKRPSQNASHYQSLSDCKGSEISTTGLIKPSRSSSEGRQNRPIKDLSKGDRNVTKGNRKVTSKSRHQFFINKKGKNKTFLRKSQPLLSKSCKGMLSSHSASISIQALSTKDSASMIDHSPLYRKTHSGEKIDPLATALMNTFRKFGKLFLLDQRQANRFLYCVARFNAIQSNSSYCPFITDNNGQCGTQRTHEVKKSIAISNNCPVSVRDCLIQLLSEDHASLPNKTSDSDEGLGDVYIYLEAHSRALQALSMISRMPRLQDIPMTIFKMLNSGSSVDDDEVVKLIYHIAQSIAGTSSEEGSTIVPSGEKNQPALKPHSLGLQGSKIRVNSSLERMWTREYPAESTCTSKRHPKTKSPASSVELVTERVLHPKKAKSTVLLEDVEPLQSTEPSTLDVQMTKGLTLPLVKSSVQSARKPRLFDAPTSINTKSSPTQDEITKADSLLENLDKNKAMNHTLKGMVTPNKSEEHRFVLGLGWSDANLTDTHSATQHTSDIARRCNDNYSDMQDRVDAASCCDYFSGKLNTEASVSCTSCSYSCTSRKMLYLKKSFLRSFWPPYKSKVIHHCPHCGLPLPQIQYPERARPHQEDDVDETLLSSVCSRANTAEFLKTRLSSRTAPTRRTKLYCNYCSFSHEDENIMNVHAFKVHMNEKVIFLNAHKRFYDMGQSNFIWRYLGEDIVRPISSLSKKQHHKQSLEREAVRSDASSLCASRVWSQRVGRPEAIVPIRVITRELGFPLQESRLAAGVPLKVIKPKAGVSPKLTNACGHLTTQTDSDVQVCHVSSIRIERPPHSSLPSPASEPCIYKTASARTTTNAVFPSTLPSDASSSAASLPSNKVPAKPSLQNIAESAKHSPAGTSVKMAIRKEKVVSVPVSISSSHCGIKVMEPSKINTSVALLSPEVTGVRVRTNMKNSVSLPLSLKVIGVRRSPNTKYSVSLTPSSEVVSARRLKKAMDPVSYTPSGGIACARRLLNAKYPVYSTPSDKVVSARRLPNTKGPAHVSVTKSGKVVSAKRLPHTKNSLSLSSSGGVISVQTPNVTVTTSLTSSNSAIIGRETSNVMLPVKSTRSRNAIIIKAPQNSCNAEKVNSSSSAVSVKILQSARLPSPLKSSGDVCSGKTTSSGEMPMTLTQSRKIVSVEEVSERRLALSPSIGINTRVLSVDSNGSASVNHSSLLRITSRPSLSKPSSPSTGRDILTHGRSKRTSSDCPQPYKALRASLCHVEYDAVTTMKGEKCRPFSLESVVAPSKKTWTRGSPDLRPEETLSEQLVGTEDPLGTSNEAVIACAEEDDIVKVSEPRTRTPCQVDPPSSSVAECPSSKSSHAPTTADFFGDVENETSPLPLDLMEKTSRNSLSENSIAPEECLLDGKFQDITPPGDAHCVSSGFLLVNGDTEEGKTKDITPPGYVPSTSSTNCTPVNGGSENLSIANVYSEPSLILSLTSKRHQTSDPTKPGTTLPRGAIEHCEFTENCVQTKSLVSPPDVSSDPQFEVSRESSNDLPAADFRLGCVDDASHVRVQSTTKEIVVVESIARTVAPLEQGDKSAASVSSLNDLAEPMTNAEINNRITESVNAPPNAVMQYQEGNSSNIRSFELEVLNTNSGTLTMATMKDDQEMKLEPDGKGKAFSLGSFKAATRFPLILKAFTAPRKAVPLESFKAATRVPLILKAFTAPPKSNVISARNEPSSSISDENFETINSAITLKLKQYKSSVSSSTLEQSTCLAVKKFKVSSCKANLNLRKGTSSITKVPLKRKKLYSHAFKFSMKLKTVKVSTFDSKIVTIAKKGNERVRAFANNKSGNPTKEPGDSPLQVATVHLTEATSQPVMRVQTRRELRSRALILP